MKLLKPKIDIPDTGKYFCINKYEAQNLVVYENCISLILLTYILQIFVATHALMHSKQLLAIGQNAGWNNNGCIDFQKISTHAINN